MGWHKMPGVSCSLSESQCLEGLRKYAPSIECEHWKGDVEEVIVHYGWFLNYVAQHTARLNDSLLKKCIMKWGGVDALKASQITSSLTLAFTFCTNKKQNITSGKLT